MVSPRGDRLHKGVVVVPQFEHEVTAALPMSDFATLELLGSTTGEKLLVEGAETCE
jgi:hypothetical protein